MYQSYLRVKLNYQEIAKRLRERDRILDVTCGLAGDVEALKAIGNSPFGISVVHGI